MVYQSSNTRAMSKSIQATSKQSQSQQFHQEENNKRLLSTTVSATKSGASASSTMSAQQQHQSHHSRMANEYVNVKNQCRRDSQSALQNQKPVYRSESSSGHQLMAPGAKHRSDHKIDGHNNQDTSGDNRFNNDQRQNGAPMTDIYADDDLAEVKTL